MNELIDVSSTCIRPDMSTENVVKTNGTQDHLTSERADSKKTTETKTASLKNHRGRKIGMEIFDCMVNASNYFKRTNSKTSIQSIANLNKLNEPIPVPTNHRGQKNRIENPKNISNSFIVKGDSNKESAGKAELSINCGDHEKDKSPKNVSDSFADKDDSKTALETNSATPINFNIHKSANETTTTESTKNVPNSLTVKSDSKTLSEAKAQSPINCNDHEIIQKNAKSPKNVSIPLAFKGDSKTTSQAKPESTVNFRDHENVKNIAKSVNKATNSLVVEGDSKTPSEAKGESLKIVNGQKGVKKMTKFEKDPTDFLKILAYKNPVYDSFNSGAKKYGGVKIGMKRKKSAEKNRAGKKPENSSDGYYFMRSKIFNFLF